MLLSNSVKKFNKDDDDDSLFRLLVNNTFI